VVVGVEEECLVLMEVLVVPVVVLDHLVGPYLVVPAHLVKDILVEALILRWPVVAAVEVLGVQELQAQQETVVLVFNFLQHLEILYQQ
jgi:hypothetical protein